MVPVSALKEALLKPDAIAVDVREGGEYRREHIAGSRSVPLSRFWALISTLPRNKDLYVFCQSGTRCMEASLILESQGFPRVFPVEGGVAAWRSAGYPVERGTGSIPIMRQVQIVAGSLALAGGLFASLRWLSILAGAGLIFAGLTGTCGMAAVLSKLPWNRFSDPGKPSGSCGLRTPAAGKNINVGTN